MVRHPGDYRWSSHAANAKSISDQFVTPHPVYEALGIDTETRASGYAALFDLPLDAQLVEDIRKATRGGYAAGSRRKRGRPPKSGTVPIFGK